jgi:hypothetical protein
VGLKISFYLIEIALVKAHVKDKIKNIMPLKIKKDI